MNDWAVPFPPPVAPDTGFTTVFVMALVRPVNVVAVFAVYVTYSISCAVFPGLVITSVPVFIQL